ncbi:Si dkey-21a6.5 [Rhizoctonia solani]|uniref:Si dkey-21a6.5 n=1 Tax=Rhizoctonia solani TaxID=456999 RepID=A0A8H7IEY5_9AGAM|nr:Si dkey-21a6.5 [Rhizoctonia solani]
MLRITAVALASLALASVMPICVTGKPSGGDGHPMLPVNPPHSGSIPGPSLWRRACQPGQYSVSGTCRSCGQGYYCSGNGDRNACPAGTYNDQTTSQRENECKAIQCGFRPSGGNADGTGATGQTMCGEGYYSKGRSTTCTICPAGMYCNAQTTCDPKPCDPGTYADTPGAGQRCKDCLLVLSITVMGTLRVAIVVLDGLVKETTRIPTASDAQTSGKFSLLRSLDRGQQRPAQTCSQSRTQSPGSCPATSGNTPSGAMTRSTTSTCPYGTTRCEVKFGRGGFECVDILNSLETCGGCDNDCSSLEGTNEVQCIKGQCVVKSCAGGHELAIRGDGFARGGLEVGAHCVAKKRNHIRHATML